MKQAYVKGTHTRIDGTLETLKGRAVIQCFDEHNQPSYQGHTDIWWEEQRTVKRDGKLVYLDEHGNEYTEDQLEFREE